MSIMMANDEYYNREYYEMSAGEAPSGARALRGALACFDIMLPTPPVGEYIADHEFSAHKMRFYRLLYDSPLDIKEIIGAMVKDERGSEYWEATLRFAELKFKQDNFESRRAARNAGIGPYDEFPADVIFNTLMPPSAPVPVYREGEDYLDRLVPGFCYAGALPWSYRTGAILTMGPFPHLMDLLLHYEGVLMDFYIVAGGSGQDSQYGHLHRGRPQTPNRCLVPFIYTCRGCKRARKVDFYTQHPHILHRKGCSDPRLRGLSIEPAHYYDYHLRIGGLFSRMRSSSSASTHGNASRPRTGRAVQEGVPSMQVVGFKKSDKEGGDKPEMARDLLSVPKPAEAETMADHLQNHKVGDIFPYVAVVGHEEETKGSRLSRLRGFKSAYNKENLPEMRINGICLIDEEGVMRIDSLKEHVNPSSITRAAQRQNKRFKPLNETTFSKPYVLISKITGEYVPMMSSTSDFTDLHFILEDGRLLDNKTIVQSVAISSNQNGVFELACDYCLSITDLPQLSLKYYLSRSVMKEGFQWGSVSLSIKVSQSDTPFLKPMVEALAISRVPYTTFEDYSKDPNRADIVYTSDQIGKFKEMYRSGDIADYDEAKTERTKVSSYSKSMVRGAKKADRSGMEFSAESGWDRLNDFKKPRLPEGEASISADSGSDESEEERAGMLTTKAQYEAHQEALRKKMKETMSPFPGSDTTEEIPDADAVRSVSPTSDFEEPKTIDGRMLKSSRKKTARFEGLETTGEDPDKRELYDFN